MCFCGNILPLSENYVNRYFDYRAVWQETDAVLAEAFIERIRRMNRSMGIPEQLAMLRKEDVPELAARALKEGNPNYPVPVIWEEEQMRAFLMEQVPK